MARIDDYKNAKKIAIEKLSLETFKDIMLRSGFETLEGDVIKVPFLDRVFAVSFPSFEFTDTSNAEKDVPIQEQVLILHYLMSESLREPTGKWISYREIPGASFYFSVFMKRAVDPLKNVFGQNISGLIEASKHLQGSPIEIGDAGFEYRILPRAPMRIILWKGDDEFPSEVNILFDEITGEILSPEDIAWMAGMHVYRLISLMTS
ncbi:MAG: DUF3786 domain-containing protein [Deltaproteobacteria bacterium]|nr:DUF3786 domain-containing protein [Deltaproteobacteria bacterium]MBW1849106.1 DUF3786 domain-containing protein [Deltaproteobacteria bacterium]